MPTLYLENTEEYKARAILANAEQILAQFIVKDRIKRQREPLFKPFTPLLDHDAIVRNIERLISIGQYGSASSASVELLDDCLAGLRYYQTYDWLFLRSIISAGYSGWIVYSLIFVAQTYSIPTSPLPSAGNGRLINGLTLLVSLSLTLLLVYKESPVLYYAYGGFPIYFWWYSLSQRSFLLSLFSSIRQDPKWLAGLGYTMAYIVSLEVLVPLKLLIQGSRLPATFIVKF